MALKLSQLDKSQYKEATSSRQDGRSGFDGFSLGVAKDLVKTGVNAVSGIGVPISRALTFGKYNSEQTPDVLEKGSAANTKLLSQLETQGGAERAGAFASQVAQYAAPTKVITKGQAILGGATKMIPRGTGALGRPLAAISRGIANVGARFAPEAAGTGAVAAVRSGADPEQVKTEATIAGSASVAFGALGAAARATYWPLLDDSVTKALGIQGKRSGGVALKETAQKTSGLQVLKQYADDIEVTLDDGTKAAFDPAQATYNTTLQAWNKTRKKIYDQYSALSSKAGQTATVNLTEVRDQIAQTLNEPTLSVYKNAARSLLKDIDDGFEDLSAVDIKRAEKFLEKLNEQTVNSFFKGTSDAASSAVNSGAARSIREQLDDVITESTGEGYQLLRSQYASLKSIEDDLVRKFQQSARSIGGGIPEYMGMLSSGDVIGGLLSGQPGQVAKGGIIGTLAALKRKLADPERFLKRSFNLIDNEVPSDFFYRVFGGTKPLSEAEQELADKIGKSLKRPGLGLSTEDITQRIHPDDLKFMREMAQKLKNNTATPDEMRILQETVVDYEFQLPKARTKQAAVLQQIVDSLDNRTAQNTDQQFIDSMTRSAQQSKKILEP